MQNLYVSKSLGIVFLPQKMSDIYFRASTRMRAARDVQARNAFVDQHRDRLESALSGAINALADARPEGLLTYLGALAARAGGQAGRDYAATSQRAP